MKRIIAVVLLALHFASAHAQVTVAEAWVRATVPQQKVTGAYMQLTSIRDARLVEAHSPIAGSVEVHETRMTNNMMRMRPVAVVELPAGKAVRFEPGGHHIMLMDLKGPLQTGDSVPLTLVVEHKDGQREKVEVKALVRPLTAHGGHTGH